MLFSGDIGQGVTQAFTQLEKVAKAVNSGTFTVNHENVLAAARIIYSQAEALHDNLREFGYRLRIAPPGKDDVSVLMTKAWNDLLVENDDSYHQRVTDYVTGLRRLATQLGDAATAYGYSEDEIQAAFGAASAE